MTSNQSIAQVTSDGTVNTQVTQDGNTAEITGGETRGSNLFHSFQDFSVPGGNEAFFNNANDVSNIFSRVTGGNISNIDGAIRANGSASLFLINPAGIVFGEGARLDLGGSFYGSTASSILFEDGEFSAADLENPPLLTVNAPIGLGFRDNPGDIINRSDLVNVESVENTSLDPEVAEAIFVLNDSRVFADDIPLEVDERTNNGEAAIDVLLELGIITEDDFITETFETVTPIGLQVSEENDFALIGGNVLITRSGITAPGGRVTLGGISQAGEVLINEDSSFTFPKEIEKADITIKGGFTLETINQSDAFDILVPEPTVAINVVSDNGGFIDIQARDLTLDGAVINFKLNEESSPSSVAGDINLSADSISLEESEINVAIVNGKIGDLNLDANSIIVDSSSINLDTSESGTVGDLNITANSTKIDNFSNIRLTAFAEEGTVGNVNINTDSIELLNVNINVEAFELNSNSGDINLTANSIELNNSSGLDITVEDGTAGDINLTAGSISLNNFSSINSRIDSQGIVGDINLTAGSISLNNSASVLSSSALSESDGKIGNINIDTNSIVIANQSNITTQTRQLDASNIQIDARELIEINGTNSSISSQTGNAGNAGDININTPKLKVLNGGQVSANNFITETFEVSPEGGLIRNILEQPQEGSGNAGTIDITANNITLEDRGGIVALSSAGEGGNINLRVNDVLSLRNNSEISATAGELDTPGNGGNINIDSQFIVAFPGGNNDITANAFNGAGGNISIATEGIFGIQERIENPLTNDITASSNAGISGNISISTPDINPVQGVTELPQDVIEPGETTAQACQTNRETQSKNGLTVTGKGGVPPAPELPLDSETIAINGKNTEAVSTTHAPIETSQGKVKPARGIKVNESGEVILTAYRTNNSGDRTPYIKKNCS